MIEYKSGERLGYIKKSPHSPECVSSIFAIESEKKRRSVLEQRGRKDSERRSGSMRKKKQLRCNSA